MIIIPRKKILVEKFSPITAIEEYLVDILSNCYEYNHTPCIVRFVYTKNKTNHLESNKVTFLEIDYSMGYEEDNSLNVNSVNARYDLDWDLYWKYIYDKVNQHNLDKINLIEIGKKVLSVMFKRDIHYVGVLLS